MRLPGQLLPDAPEPLRDQGPAAPADAGNLRAREEFAEVEKKDLDGSGFSQAAVGVQSGEQLKNLGCQAEVWLIGLRGLGRRGLAARKGLPPEKALNRRQLLRRRLEKLQQQLDWEGLSHPFPPECERILPVEKRSSECFLPTRAPSGLRPMRPRSSPSCNQSSSTHLIATSPLGERY